VRDVSLHALVKIRVSDLHGNASECCSPICHVISDLTSTEVDEVC
jgi:hypothetical protein